MNLQFMHLCAGTLEFPMNGNLHQSKKLHFETILTLISEPITCHFYFPPLYLVAKLSLNTKMFTSVSQYSECQHQWFEVFTTVAMLNICRQNVTL